MSKSIKWFVGVVMLTGAFVLPASGAFAAGETASVDMTITPQGAMYKNTPKPVNFGLEINVVAPPTEPRILPIKHVAVDLPDNVVTRPNDSLTPPCTDNSLSQVSNLSNPGGILASCPDSTVGSGSSSFVIAKLNQNPGAVLLDPMLIVFYAGRNTAGETRLKIYGFSKATGLGFLFEGTWKADRLEIAIPVISYDSAVNHIGVQIPGGAVSRPDINVNFQGRDGEFVRAACPTGSWVTSGSFQLGERDPSTGVDTGPTSTVPAASSSDPCSGTPDPTRNLTVTKAGSGTITSNPAGINCGSTCSVGMPEDTEVTLTATPDSGALFLGWTGACSGTGTCQVEMTADNSVGAKFGPAPPAGPVGVSVNGGAKYTNDPAVQLSLVWPSGEATAFVSNDGGFADGQTLDLSPLLPWTLDSTGPERLPKTVYVRFGASTQNYTDDIILDETAPVVSSVTAGGASSSSLRSVATVSKSRKVTLKIKASDKTSGVAQLQVGTKKSTKLAKQKFKSKVKLKTSAKKLWVRVIDRAGNPSKWKSVRLG